MPDDHGQESRKKSTAEIGTGHTLAMVIVRDAPFPWIERDPRPARIRDPP
ncbi:hypothetical protein [Nocardia mikamii]|nr:hypothetical protein [Nocardia mikamii]